MTNATSTRTVDTSRRTIKHTIEGADPSVIVEVTTYHNADRKHYRTSITAYRRKGGVVTTILTFRDGPICPLGDAVTPVARHSAKALDAAHHAAYGALAEDAALNAALYEWAVEFLAYFKR